MVWLQALLCYWNYSNGSFKTYTSSITSYNLLQDGNISFSVYNISGMPVDGSMMIFASLQLSQNVSLVDHV